jgi:hypothetical protein
MGKYGYIDRTGRVVIQPQWQDVGNFSNGLAPVHMGGGEYGYVDATGEIVIEPQFNKAAEFVDGIAVVSIFYERGRIDEKGVWIR